MSEHPGIEHTRQLIALMERINEETDPHRRQVALVAWARSDWFSGGGMLLEGWHGQLHREAWRAVMREAEADTPAMAWRRADLARGRQSILRALKIDQAEPSAFYATWPFRIINTAEDECWIAGAVGCPQLLHMSAHDLCPELDITDVIIWNPATGAVRLLGEATTASSIVLPHLVEAGIEHEVTLYADPFAFFRAWADRRAETWGRMRALKRKPTEARDGDLPGALVIGDLFKMRLPLDASVLQAGPGVAADKLTKAIYRQAKLPRVQALAA